MAKDQHRNTKIILAELWKKASDEAFKVNVPVSDLTPSAYKKRSSIEKKSHIDTKFVMVEPSLLPSLDSREQYLVIKLMSELKRNNALWYFDYRTAGGRDERAILSLRKRGILYKTGVTEIHLINPWFIRRGTVEVVVVATNELVNEGQLTKRMIKDLTHPTEASLNGYYAIIADE